MAQGVQDQRYQAAVEALRSARIAKGLSQAELARRLGNRQQFVSKYESRERRLDIIEFIDAAIQLEVDWARLLKEEASPVDGS